MKFVFFAFKSLSRNPVRATLTLLGVGVAIFLFTSVVSVDQGMRRMLANSTGDDTLVVFDKYQGCPPLSKLPTSWGAFEHVLWNQMLAGKFSRTFDPEDRRRLFD